MSEANDNGGPTWQEKRWADSYGESQTETEPEPEPEAPPEPVEPKP